MTLDRDRLLELRMPAIEQAYTRKDVQLYALGINHGSDPLDPADLAYVYEKKLIVPPTFALVLGVVSLKDMGLGIDFTRVVHAEQAIESYRPLAPEGTVVTETRITEVWDLGATKGAVLAVQRDLFDPAGVHLARCVQKALCRNDGGFGGAAPPPRSVVPGMEREPDVRSTIEILPQQALLYRLSGDRNPLHVDPEAARAAGFERPILHGLATFGLIARELLRRYAAHDATRFNAMSARFSAAVFPGRPMDLHAWNAAGRVAFKAFQDSRLVIDGGSFSFGDARAP
jgi:acyl dehydratase